MFFRSTRLPHLRRSTHHYCGYCGGNLEEYGTKRCDLCLVDLGTGDPRWISYIKSKFRKCKNFIGSILYMFIRKSK